MPYLFGKVNSCVLFRSCNSFVGDLSSWDVSNVTTMEGMLNNCQSFDSDLSGWEVSKCTNMREVRRDSYVTSISSLRSSVRSPHT